MSALGWRGGGRETAAVLLAELDELMMWVVYEKIPPYPLSYQARELRVTAAGPQPTGQHVVGPLGMLRTYLGEHLRLTRIGRDPDDDATAVETWL